RAIGGTFRRIQFTSDLLPADITGVSVWRPAEKAFAFEPGPIFGNLVLADEINRAPPKTQSALLEATSEGQVSVDGRARPLPRPFMVIATQNSMEHHGTYPLPESQLDRFLMSISMGYPDPDAERLVVARPSLADPVDSIEPVLDPASAAAMFAAVDRVRFDDAVLDYLMDLVQRTRRSELLALGVGPRGGMALHRAARALSLLEGRDFALVDDVRRLAVPVLAHRVVPAASGADGTGDRRIAARAIREIVGRLEIPL
ncbi:MAG TPA: AAA family ATPase, partial [Polyangia bacterium]|nr:AAA family ATPase [Polyangia bacterium]